MLLNCDWVSPEIKGKINSYLGANENEHTTIQYLWETAKPVLRRKFIALQAY